MKIVIFDLETRVGPLDLYPQDETAGWEALRNGEGGISALVVYDSEQDWVYTYDEKSLHAAVAHLESSDLIVTYCGSKFDIPVIEGILGRKLRFRHHLDLYVEIVQESVKRGKIGHKGDFTLNSVCARTLGQTKYGNGSMVMNFLKEGRHGELFNYCSHDVKLTKDLFEHIKLHGGCQGLNNTFLPVPIPEWIKKAVI